jgi:hypothetical protein
MLMLSDNPIPPATVRPELSVVIASFSGISALTRCLESLLAQCHDPAAVEVIAATNLSLEELATLAQRFETVRLMTAPRGTSVFRLRTLGVEQARGKVIALSEDHVTFGSGWLASILKAAKDHPIVGGPIENGLQGLYDWALFSCEYVTFMPPSPDGPAGVLSGVNVAYRRELLDQTRPVWQDTFHENEVHDALRQAGYPLYCVGDAVVSSHLIMPLKQAMHHLFTGARHYGRYRKGRTAGFGRYLLPLGVIFVPGILFWRILRAVMTRRPGRLGTIFLALGYILCLLGAWSIGEAAGYLTEARGGRGGALRPVPGGPVGIDDLAEGR